MRVYGIFQGAEAQEQVTTVKEPVTLKTLQRLISMRPGDVPYITPVKLGKRTIFVDEDGIPKSLPFNMKASLEFNVTLYGVVVELEKGERLR